MPAIDRSIDCVGHDWAHRSDGGHRKPPPRCDRIMNFILRMMGFIVNLMDFMH